jgi:hypothetical protein
VKDILRANTEAALARGVYGVPTFAIDDELFWGDDVTDMFLDYLADPALFESGDLSRLRDLPVAAQRRESRLGKENSWRFSARLRGSLFILQQKREGVGDDAVASPLVH